MRKKCNAAQLLDSDLPRTFVQMCTSIPQLIEKVRWLPLESNEFVVIVVDEKELGCPYSDNEMTVICGEYLEKGALDFHHRVVYQRL